jgi:hypothetical protein
MISDGGWEKEDVADLYPALVEEEEINGKGKTEPINEEEDKKDTDLISQYLKWM